MQMPQPKCLPQFRHINRYWDREHQHWAAKILPGEYYVTHSPDEVIATTLGSCVSACVRDTRNGIGGMNHFMLPLQASAEHGWVDAATRYGSYAMEHLINDILKQGGERRYLEVKLSGGGKIMANMTDVGRRNIEFIRHYLDIEGLPLTAEDLGDIYPRKVLYYPITGVMRVKKLRRLHNDTLIKREQAYRAELETQPDTGDVELF